MNRIGFMAVLLFAACFVAPRAGAQAVSEETAVTPLSSQSQDSLAQSGAGAVDCDPEAVVDPDLDEEAQFELYLRCIESFRKQVDALNEGSSSEEVMDVAERQVELMKVTLDTMIGHMSETGVIGVGLTQLYDQIERKKSTLGLFEKEEQDKRQAIVQELETSLQENESRAKDMRSQMTNMLKVIVDQKPLLAWDIGAKKIGSALDTLSAALTSAETIMKNFDVLLREVREENREGN